MPQTYITRLPTLSGCKSRVHSTIFPTTSTANQHADKEAGQAFEKCAAVQIKNLNEPDDAANTMTEAFKVYRKENPLDACRCLDQAINQYTSKGNFRRAATQKQNLAEVYEIEVQDLPKAIESYEIAASWFETDNAEAYVSVSQFTLAMLT